MFFSKKASKKCRASKFKLLYIQKKSVY